VCGPCLFAGLAQPGSGCAVRRRILPVCHVPFSGLVSLWRICAVPLDSSSFTRPLCIRSGSCCWTSLLNSCLSPGMVGRAVLDSLMAPGSFALRTLANTVSFSAPCAVCCSPWSKCVRGKEARYPDRVRGVADPAVLRTSGLTGYGCRVTYPSPSAGSRRAAGLTRAVTEFRRQSQQPYIRQRLYISRRTSRRKKSKAMSTKYRESGHERRRSASTPKMRGKRVWAYRRQAREDLRCS